MATNVNLSYPNFSLTAQAGTFGSINTAEADTRLRIKNTAGGLISDYTLSSNIVDDNILIALEYCGPLNLSEMIDNVTFFTVERVPDIGPYGLVLDTSEQVIVKRWETNVRFSTLDLKQQWHKYTTGSFDYSIVGAAVEHYHRSFSIGTPSGRNYLDMNSASKLQAGDTLFLGPSSDSDNIGATEKAVVSFITGSRVFLNSPLIYQYADNDQITFFNNIYLIGDKGNAGDERYGTIFKHDIMSGTRLEYTRSGEYARITGARWSTEVGAIAAINSSQLLFIRPYDSYLKWKSMFLNNIQSNNKDYFEVYDIVFDEFNVYKLMKKATTKDDQGHKITETWPTYNYQQDTLLPYTHNVSIYMYQQYTVGPDNTRIYAQTRDQFGISLRDVNLEFEHDGSDAGAQFDPIDGKETTDINGEADVGYTPGGLYTGPTIVRVRADKSSSFTGSEYCWNEILIDGKIEYTTGFGAGAMFQKSWHSDSMRGRQIYDPFQIEAYRHVPGAEEMVITEPKMYLISHSHFGQPGGNWTYPSNNSGDIDECWPWFQLTPPLESGPTDERHNMSCEWECITWPPGPDDPSESERCDPNANRYDRNNFIKQVLDVSQFGVNPSHYLDYLSDPENFPASPWSEDDFRGLRLAQPDIYRQYHQPNLTCDSRCTLEEGEPVLTRAFQLDSIHDLHFSQLNLSKHSHWVDGAHSLTLNTNVRLDQFIFVEDAVPGFWSEKNPRETDIWIRMRPFAFSLNGDTLKFFVREVYTVDDVYYDTGYYDVIERYGWPPNNDRVTLQYFDAGGGVLGIEFTYDNPDIFHHNGIVYVHIEVYDTAAEPNFIYTDYWFKIIPDYNAPYLENEDPSREEDQVPLDTRLYFEIKDSGEGVDIDTLEVYLNSRIVYHAGFDANPDTIIEKVNGNHYKVTIDLPYDLQYGKEYSVGVTAKDISENKNILRDSYRFYTRQSEVPWFTAFDPKKCLRGMPRFKDVSFIVLAGGDGIDPQTIRIQVHDQDVTDKSKITPVIYRVS
jgi:hypothetical protein